MPPPGTTHADGGGGTHAHNTLSVDNTDVQVFYPFHPLHGVTLRVLRRPERGDGAVCVVDPAGRRLKIPIWMHDRHDFIVTALIGVRVGWRCLGNDPGRATAAAVWRSAIGRRVGCFPGWLSVSVKHITSGGDVVAALSSRFCPNVVGSHVPAVLFH